MRKNGWKRLGTWGVSALLVPALLVGGSWVPAGGSRAAMAASASASTSGFTDVASHWGKATIDWAVSKGIVDGFADGTFQPDKTVSEAQFLAMLLRAFAGDAIPAAGADAAWYAGYYAYASELRWPVDPAHADAPYSRGQVARVLAASQGQDLDTAGAVRYLLERGLATGKTSATVEGFGVDDRPTRAEALQFIRNLADKHLVLKGIPAPARAFAVRGVSLGDSAESVQSKLGTPARKDASEYGFEWYVYNQDYASYAQIGISGGKVVALYTNSTRWASDKPGVSPSASSADIVKTFGRPLDSITKGFTRYMLNNPGEEEGVYELDGGYVTFFYDTHENDALEAIQIVSKEAEEAKTDYYGTPSEALRIAFERETFDLANAARVKRGLKPFVWDDAVAGTARKHSEDMGVKGYFDHKSPTGERLADRYEADGIDYRSGAENIAAGQPNAIYAHAGWLNSHTGHRESLLGPETRLGVGVYFGGKMHVYYTQNFYTPMNG
ncbi:CAP-associated domain-containing protein [Paenibacillus flagellatus]|uniref:Copper amine oxidase n=1 Tax=Paenibacillus flagellatus TaxID=2211139 RepID=A0A2V5K1Z4_9BACL|nr:CAP-associated domain-containing protein [Paenibacillus flagellatus]PYI53171.1 copper amine oxidase [Paenibacillus flagellatus]